MIEYSSIFYRHRAYRENAALGTDGIVDLRKLGCPEHIYRRVLETRAKKLGSTMRETAVAQDALATEVEGSKLF